MLSFFKSKQPEIDKFSLKRLKDLYENIKTSVISSHNEDFIIKSLFSICEIIIYGDQNEEDCLLEYFCEQRMPEYFLNVLKNPICPVSMQVQVLQALSMLAQNIRSEMSLFFLLSNNYINDIIKLPLRFYDEEVLDYYVCLLKTLSLSLNDRTVYFFFVDNRGKMEYQLYCHSFLLRKADDPMVRTASRTIMLKVFENASPAVLKFLMEDPQVEYFGELVNDLRDMVISVHKSIEQHNQDDGAVGEFCDMLTFFEDVALQNHKSINDHLRSALALRFLTPLLNTLFPESNINAPKLWKELKFTCPQGCMNDLMPISKEVALFSLTQFVNHFGDRLLCSSLCAVLMIPVQFDETCEMNLGENGEISMRLDSPMKKRVEENNSLVDHFKIEEKIARKMEKLSMYSNNDSLSLSPSSNEESLPTSQENGTSPENGTSQEIKDPSSTEDEKPSTKGKETPKLPKITTLRAELLNMLSTGDDVIIRNVIALLFSLTEKNIVCPHILDLADLVPQTDRYVKTMLHDLTIPKSKNLLNMNTPSIEHSPPLKSLFSDPANNIDDEKNTNKNNEMSMESTDNSKTENEDLKTPNKTNNNNNNNNNEITHHQRNRSSSNIQSRTVMESPLTSQSPEPNDAIPVKLSSGSPSRRRSATNLHRTSLSSMNGDSLFSMSSPSITGNNANSINKHHRRLYSVNSSSNMSHISSPKSATKWSPNWESSRPGTTRSMGNSNDSTNSAKRRESWNVPLIALKTPPSQTRSRSFSQPCSVEMHMINPENPTVLSTNSPLLSFGNLNNNNNNNNDSKNILMTPPISPTNNDIIATPPPMALSINTIDLEDNPNAKITSSPGFFSSEDIKQKKPKLKKRRLSAIPPTRVLSDPLMTPLPASPSPFSTSSNTMIDISGDKTFSAHPIKDMMNSPQKPTVTDAWMKPIGSNNDKKDSVEDDKSVVVKDEAEQKQILIENKEQDDICTMLGISPDDTTPAIIKLMKISAAVDESTTILQEYRDDLSNAIRFQFKQQNHRSTCFPKDLASHLLLALTSGKYRSLQTTVLILALIRRCILPHGNHQQCREEKRIFMDSIVTMTDRIERCLRSGLRGLWRQQLWISFLNVSRDEQNTFKVLEGDVDLTLQSADLLVKQAPMDFFGFKTATDSSDRSDFPNAEDFPFTPIECPYACGSGGLRRVRDILSGVNSRHNSNSGGEHRKEETENEKKKTKIIPSHTQRHMWTLLRVVCDAMDSFNASHSKPLLRWKELIPMTFPPSSLEIGAQVDLARVQWLNVNIHHDGNRVTQRVLILGRLWFVLAIPNKIKTHASVETKAPLTLITNIHLEKKLPTAVFLFIRSMMPVTLATHIPSNNPSDTNLWRLCFSVANTSQREEATQHLFRHRREQLDLRLSKLCSALDLRGRDHPKLIL
eukprot:TRINITY_DN55_c1_g1_i1.p1 TRINITY_DN55_c1_g1~~TRINITY_DN55_c1_g1_i1.p1  ORF type:complete len:1407 (+),score=378.68 TRINITY_DN55_c1_g1_i1:68-4288(+)